MSYPKGRGQHRYKDITGQRFGRLVAIRFIGKDKWCRALWECRCDCGNTRIVMWRNLKSGDTRSCGCLQKEIVADRNRKAKGEASFDALYKKYQYDAQVRGLEFNLTKDQFKELTKQDCSYCGQPPSQAYGQRKFNGYYIYNGIDRVDPSKGYALNNCVTACSTCNYAKQGLTAKQFIDLAKRIYDYSENEIKQKEEYHAEK